VRVLIGRAQQKPVGVRNKMDVVPGRLPLRHQFPAPLLRTIQPRAQRASPSGQVGAGAVISFMVSGFRSAGMPGAPATWLRNWTSSVGEAIHPPWESMPNASSFTTAIDRGRWGSRSIRHRC